MIINEKRVVLHPIKTRPRVFLLNGIVYRIFLLHAVCSIIAATSIDSVTGLKPCLWNQASVFNSLLPIKAIYMLHFLLMRGSNEDIFHRMKVIRFSKEMLDVWLYTASEKSRAELLS